MVPIGQKKQSEVQITQIIDKSPKMQADVSDGPKLGN